MGLQALCLPEAGRKAVHVYSSSWFHFGMTVLHTFDAVVFIQSLGTHRVIHLVHMHLIKNMYQENCMHLTNSMHLIEGALN